MSGDSSVRFDRLEINGWRQFKAVSIDFHPRLTVLTGANGSGKTSILGVLSRHFAWNHPFLSVPVRHAESGAYSYLTGFWDADSEDGLDSSQTAKAIGSQVPIGTLRYSDGVVGNITVPALGSIQYAPNISPSPPVQGVFVTSGKPLQGYQRVTEIPTEPMLPNLAYQQWFTALVQRYSGVLVQHSPAYRMKQALISMAMFGPGNQFSPPIPEISLAFDGFIEVLRKILPESLGFKTLSIRTPDIVFVTDSGEWVIDEASGGIFAIIELAWQIFLFSSGTSNFVALIDEPENHLHPSMQKKIMIALVDAFPKVQFIVATHSPFIVSSVKDSTVYVLAYQRMDAQDEPNNPVVHPPPLEVGFYNPGVKRRVVSQRLDLITKAGSASEVLRDVLGVPATTPDWVAAEINAVVSRFRDRPFSTETLNDMRTELESIGMRDRFPEALAGLAEEK